MDAQAVLRFERTWAYACADTIAFMKTMPDNCIHCIVTSPPYYGLRDYGVDGQIGLEESPQAFIAKLVDVFRECMRVLHPSGVLWLNMGDSYCTGSKGRTHDASKSMLHGGLATQDACRRQPSKIHPGWKPKDMMGMPWRLAFALQDDGWYLRSDCIWAKTNAMPESVPDRPSKAHEYVFMLSKSPRYFYDQDSCRTPQKSLGKKHEGKSGYKDGHPSKQNGHVGMTRQLHPGGAAMRTIWTMPVGRTKNAHFATFPKHLVRPCVRLGSSAKGCCPTCLEPWVRVVKKIRVATRPGAKSKVKVPSGWDTDNGSHGTIHKDGRRLASDVTGNRDPERHCTERIPVGWKQNCKCDEAEPVPCLVFDPFLGSGTTIQVAVEEGRRGFGIELNPKYCTFIDRRMETVQPCLFGRV